MTFTMLACGCRPVSGPGVGCAFFKEIMARSALAALAVLATLGSPVIALAQRTPEQAPNKPTSVMMFTPQDIAGNRQGPGMETIYARPKTVFPTLVRVRVSFADEIIRSSDEL
jgi:hypothetical protein